MIFINKYFASSTNGEYTRRLPTGVVIEQTPSNNYAAALFDITLHRTSVVEQAIEQLINVLSDDPSVLKLPLR